MKRLFFLFTVFFLVSVAAYNQSLVSYDWGDALYEDAPGAMYDTVAAAFLKSITRLEMVYNDDGDLDEYQLVHQKIKINNNQALERFNTLSFPLYSYGEIIDLKARFIGKDNKFIELDTTHLKTVDKEEDTYKLLAIEGAQAGGIIEYYWIRKGYRNLFDKHLLQTNYPKRHAAFDITCPYNLRFISKSYNGAPNMVETIDTVKRTRVLALGAYDIPALRSERYAHYEANLQRVEYSVAYNFSYNQDRRIYSRDQSAQYFHKSVATLNSEENKAFISIAKKIKISKKMSTEEKIRVIENYVKTNFQLINESVYGLDISSINGIFATKYADKLGYSRLFSALFKHFDIEFDLVVTCNKSKRKFDNEFDGYNFLVDNLFYFPQIKNFLDPNSIYNRLGIIDTDFVGNEALFYKTVNIGGVESLMPVSGFIPENDYTQSRHSTIINMKINAETPSLEYKIVHSFSNYMAALLQPFMYFVDNEQKILLAEDFLQADKNSNRLINWSISNIKPEEWFVKPLIINGVLSGNMFINRAGNDLLLRIGELIGKQVEMYQEKDRKLPIESETTRCYDRVIELEIPNGYEIINPEALKMKVELIENDNVEAYFYSDYSFSGKKLTVNCTEGYKKIFYPVEKYAEYVAVINAAADFNKIVLILKKK